MISTENLISLGVYLMNGNRPFIGQEVIIELKYKNLQRAKIIDFKENLTDYNRLTMCRVCENTATLELKTGEIITNFPFSMINLAELSGVVDREQEYLIWLHEVGNDIKEEHIYFGEDFYE